MLSRLLSAKLALLAGLTLLSGCLTIEEHYRFRRNGSGSMTYVLDMSELGSMISAFGESADGGGNGLGDMGAMNMSEQVDALRSIPGVSKVKLDGKKKWVQRISFDFRNVTALNAALNVLMPDSSGVPNEFFRWEEGTLVRTTNRHAYELGSGLAKGDEQPEEDGEEAGPLDMSMMLESMKYSYSFKFARTIGNVRSAEGVNVQQRGKELKLDTDFAVIGRDPKALDLRIAFP